MPQSVFRFLLISLALFCAGCQASLQSQVEQSLSASDQTGIRWGLVIADMSGEELLAIRPDERFTPASNTKIVTTMAAYHYLDALSDQRRSPGTQVLLEPGENGGPPDLVLKGGGDAILSDAADCETTCLSALADQVMAHGGTEFGAVIGDDTLFTFEPYGPGWSQEDLQFYYGAAVSALSLNDNIVRLELTPGDQAGAAAIAAWDEGDTYYHIENQVRTISADGAWTIGLERLQGARSVRVFGEVPAGAEARDYWLAIGSPAAFAASRFKRLLETRGALIDRVETRHRPRLLSDLAPDPEAEAPVEATLIAAAPSAAPAQIIASLPPSPLTTSLARISKDSENLHAEIVLHRLGLIDGTGSRSYGVAKLEAFLTEVGLDEQGYALHGGSGMSIYNRLSPRALVQLLAFAAEQSWFEAWLADQPIAGIDGSLERRFVGTALEGKLFAKTGTLNGANALSGVMEAASGRQLLFSIIANDRPGTSPSAIPQMDQALALIAATY